jgi:hypothetical protein
LLEKGFNTVSLKIFTSVKSSTFSTHFFCGQKGRFTTQSAGPAALFISLCNHFLFLVMGRSYMLLISSPSMSLVVSADDVRVRRSDGAELPHMYQSTFENQRCRR